jgi:NTP pyrophosphatase (non-canonical NTP hydrolase)
MDFNQYQEVAVGTAVYPSVGGNLVYPALGIAGEGGEYADKVKKMWRNRDCMSVACLSPQERVDMAKELGDILWYIAASAKELGYYLDEIASFNVEKILDRRKRGVVKSEGDNR